MRLPIASSAAAAALFLTPVAAGYAPALSQEFSITNPVAPTPAFPGRPDLMRQLQAWWDVHGYYPRHASNSDEGGYVKIHLEILPDGRIWSVKVVESSGSQSVDAAAVAVFKSGFVTRAPDGTPEADPDLTLHYVLAHRHDQPVPAGYKSAPSRRPFTIANDPVISPILETMIQKTCTGEIVRQGIRNHPWYGTHNWAQAIFFRRPDGTPWVKFYEGGYPILSPVTEVGKMIQWTGREERQLRPGITYYTNYTVWSDGTNKISGNLETVLPGFAGAQADSANLMNRGGTVDLTCEMQTVPAVGYNSLFTQTMVTPPGDPP